MNILGALLKAKRGELGADELMEMLSTAGIDADFAPVALASAGPEFAKLAKSASLPSASLARLCLRMKNGQRFEGLLVLRQDHTHS